jgi:integrase
LRTKNALRAKALQKAKDLELNQAKARQALGIQVAPIIGVSWTLRAFCGEYEHKVLTEQLVSRNTFNRTERWALDSLLRFRPTADLADLNEAWLRDYQTAIKPTLAPSTWNSRRAILRAIFNRAVKWKWISVNPFAALDRAKVIKTRPKRLYQEQLPLVLAACSRFWQLVTLFFYATGCRLGELCNVTRRAVRWDQGYVEIPTNKENQPKLIALTSDLSQIIREAECIIDSEYIFSVNGGRLGEEGIKSKYDRISKIVGFRVSPHRFRHSHGTHRMEAGDHLKSVQTTLGHADIRTTATFYLDVDLAAQRRAMSLLPIKTLLEIHSNRSKTVDETS